MEIFEVRIQLTNELRTTYSTPGLKAKTQQDAAAAPPANTSDLGDSRVLSCACASITQYAFLC